MMDVLEEVQSCFCFSFGFCLVLAYVLFKISRGVSGSGKASTFVYLSIVLVIVGGDRARTVLRNEGLDFYLIL